MDAFIGTVTLFAGNFPPRGWFICNGQILQIRQYNALFAILGNKFGGDGRTTFALPNLPPLPDSDGKGQSIYIICSIGIFPPRD